MSVASKLCADFTHVQIKTQAGCGGRSNSPNTYSLHVRHREDKSIKQVLGKLQRRTNYIMVSTQEGQITETETSVRKGC